MFVRFFHSFPYTKLLLVALPENRIRIPLRRAYNNEYRQQADIDVLKKKNDRFVLFSAQKSNRNSVHTQESLKNSIGHICGSWIHSTLPKLFSDGQLKYLTHVKWMENLANVILPHIVTCFALKITANWQTYRNCGTPFNHLRKQIKEQTSSFYVVKIVEKSQPNFNRGSFFTRITTRGITTREIKCQLILIVIIFVSDFMFCHLSGCVHLLIGLNSTIHQGER